MAIVLDERPHDVRFHFVQHLAVVVAVRDARRGLLRLRHQSGVRFGDGHEAGGPVRFHHRLQVSPDVRMYEPDDGDLVVLGRQRQGQGGKRGQNEFHGQTL